MNKTESFSLLERILIFLFIISGVPILLVTVIGSIVINCLNFGLLNKENELYIEGLLLKYTPIYFYNWGILIVLFIILSIYFSWKIKKLQ
jgi:hypothetical protein